MLAEFLHLLEEETTLPSSNRLETKSTPMILDAPEILAPSAAYNLIKDKSRILYCNFIIFIITTMLIHKDIRLTYSKANSSKSKDGNRRTRFRFCNIDSSPKTYKHG